MQGNFVPPFFAGDAFIGHASDGVILSAPEIGPIVSQLTGASAPVVAFFAFVFSMQSTEQ